MKFYVVHHDPKVECWDCKWCNYKRNHTLKPHPPIKKNKKR